MSDESSPAATLCQNIKYFYSIVLLIFSIILVTGLIFTQQTSLSRDTHAAVAFIVMWLAILWLTMVEGSQASMVGLAPVARELYKDTHKIAHKVTSIVLTGDNLDRYLLGRQLMVVLVVFVVNLSGAPLAGAELWGLPAWITNIFLVTGIAMILFTCMVGQLNSQVNGCHCMLDYINNYFALFTIYVAMFIEFTGILHASYVFNYIICWMAGKPVVSKEGERTPAQSVFFWGRCVMSLVLLALAFVVTMAALFEGKTTMWSGVPPAAAVVVFLMLMCVVGLLEGMQIAFFAVTKVTKAERGNAKFAMMTCECLFRGEGRNLPAFMIGRQICVVSCMFVVARVTTLNVVIGEGNLFGVSNGLQTFFNTGLLGAYFLTICGSIVWQLVASVFPIAFLSNPLVYFMLRLCLLLESTGICAGAWVIAMIHKAIAGFKRDEVYIGTAEERAAKNLVDDGNQIGLGAGHPRKLPNFIECAPRALKDLLHNDPAVLEFIHSIRKVGLSRDDEDDTDPEPDLEQQTSNEIHA
jgi:silicon transporter